MSETDPPLPLGETARDKAVAVILRGAAGAVPFAGTFLGELVSQLIPNQRLQRIEAFLLRLQVRLDAADVHLEDKLRSPESIDLFEDGAHLAVRALSDQRMDYIANLVSHGLSGGERARIEAKRLVNLLAAVSDDQIIILTSKLRKHMQDHEFQELHKDVLDAPRIFMSSSQEDQDKAVLYEHSRTELVRLGLLQPRFPNSNKTEVPEFDFKTGMIKSRGTDLTRLGRMMLTQIGLAEPDER